LPPKSPFDLVALPVEGPIEPPKLLSDRDGLLGIAPVGIDHRFHLLVFDRVPIGLRVKSRIEDQSCPREVDTQATGKGNKIRQGLWENKGIVLVDWFDRDRAEDKAVIVNDRQLFFSFLMFMAAIADAFAPFFTMVLEPSP
jgi:hypothetical protein